MWDLPRPGLEPVSPALAGRFSTTAPPGKPRFGSSEASLLGLQVATFLLCLHMVRGIPSVSLYQIFNYKNTSQTGLGPTLMLCFNLITSLKALFQIGIFWGTGRWGFNILICGEGNTIQPIIIAPLNLSWEFHETKLGLIWVKTCRNNQCRSDWPSNHVSKWLSYFIIFCDITRLTCSFEFSLLN